MAAEARGIQSIEVGGVILSALVAGQKPVSLRDLAAATDMAPAQVHAYLTSFRRIGLVEQDSQTGQYFMGPFALRLGLGRVHSDEILNRTSQALAPLSAETGHMTVLVVWGPQGPTVVQRQDGLVSLNLNIRIGTLFSVIGTASGWVYAAFKTDNEVSKRIEFESSDSRALFWSNPHDVQAVFEREVARTRKRGYASMADIAIPGISAISVPVFDADSRMSCAITVIGKSEHFDVGTKSEVVKKTLAVAKSLQR